MLAVDLLELLGRLLEVLLLIEEVETLVVELVGGLVGNELFGVEEAAAGERRRDERERRQARAKRAPHGAKPKIVCKPPPMKRMNPVPCELQPAAAPADQSG